MSDSGQLLYEGEAKRLFSTDEHDRSLMEFKDDATAIDGKKELQFNDATHS